MNIFRRIRRWWTHRSLTMRLEIYRAIERSET